MQVKSKLSSTPFMFALVGGLGLGLAYGVVRSFHLGWVAMTLSLAACCLVLWLIYRQGKAGAYANAQAWAQSQVDIAIEVTNTAQAKANALSEAYSMAIAQAQATAANYVTVNMPEAVTGGHQAQEVIIPSIEPQLFPVHEMQKEATNAQFHAQSSDLAMGEFIPQEPEIMRSATDS